MCVHAYHLRLSAPHVTLWPMSTEENTATTTTEEIWYEDVRVERNKDSTATITARVPDWALAKLRPRALKAIGERLEFPGFRKGHAPEALVVERVGEPTVLEEVAHLALQRAWPTIVMDEKLDVIGRPEVSFTTLAPGNPITYRVRVTLYPEVTLPDYRAVAAKIVKDTPAPDTVTASEKDVEDAIEDIRTRLTKPSELVLPDGSKGEPVKPELTDEFVKTLGPFTDVADFRTKITEHVTADKRQKAHEKRRIEIADALIAKTKLTVPDLFIESELAQMVREFEENVTRMGLTMEGYLEHVKKSVEDMRKEWRGDAEKRAKLQLILAAIAKDAHVHPDEHRLEREVAHIKEHYSEADEASVRAYVSFMMLNEAVFEMLEGKNAHTHGDHSHTHEKDTE